MFVNVKKALQDVNHRCLPAAKEEIDAILYKVKHRRGENIPCQPAMNPMLMRSIHATAHALAVGSRATNWYTNLFQL